MEAANSAAKKDSLFDGISVRVLEHVLERIFEHVDGNQNASKLAKRGVDCYFQILEINAKKGEQIQVESLEEKLKVMEKTLGDVQDQSKIKTVSLSRLKERLAKEQEVTSELHKKIETQANTISNLNKAREDLRIEDSDQLKPDQNCRHDLHNALLGKHIAEAREMRASWLQENAVKREKKLTRTVLRHLDELEAALNWGKEKDQIMTIVRTHLNELGAAMKDEEEALTGGAAET